MTGFLAQNSHLRENYLAVCKALDVEPFTDDAPEELAVIGLEKPSEEIMRRLREFDSDESRAAHSKSEAG